MIMRFFYINYFIIVIYEGLFLSYLDTPGECKEDKAGLLFVQYKKKEKMPPERGNLVLRDCCVMGTQAFA